jgi:hypothetical protein
MSQRQYQAGRCRDEPPVVVEKPKEVLKLLPLSKISNGLHSAEKRTDTGRVKAVPQELDVGVVYQAVVL